ncbi:MAG: M23 family metallopeptidase [Pseudomonadota bacterium]
MDKVDPRFKAAKNKAASRKRTGFARTAFLGLVTVFALGAAGFGLVRSGIIGLVDTAPSGETVAAAPDDAVAYVSPFIDVPGDPLKLELEDTASGLNISRMALPAGVGSERSRSGAVLIRDVMFTRDTRIVTTLPTSREDFAFFQTQRSVPVEESVGNSTSSGNSTSLKLVPERLRLEPTSDVIVKLTEARQLDDILAEYAIADTELPEFSSALAPAVDSNAPLQPGSIVAVRVQQDGVARRPIQLSVYGPDGYLASAAASDDDAAVTAAADPWYGTDLDLLGQNGDGDEAVESAQEFRLLDAIYSTALRNGMPTEHLGQAVVLLSRAFDLDAFAQPGDRLVMLYTNEASDGSVGPGQILFVAVEKKTGRLACYVAQPSAEGEYRCYGGSASDSAGSGPRLRADMTLPVNGVLRASFGPQRNSKTGEVEQHDGVDWAAPRGTAVRAALAGSVVALDNDPIYGTTVTLSHADGATSFYAHLDATTVASGANVAAGDTIGTVGATGQTDVPHLHFEFREAGIPVDPFIHDSGGLAGEAVELLVNQIIRVESAGNAQAANPNSTARGLGQFIESTWIRMMNTYRPDLAASLSREELLELRFDETLSYQMVTNLARESEAYLSARGHRVTAGRLYLAHFLGTKGAHVVLSSPDESPLIDVLGEGVIRANNFLEGHDVAYIKGWADRKMQGRKGGRKVVILPPEVQAYKTAIDTALAGG